MKTVAVVTDAMSPDHFFPKWYAYYGGAFGAASLYVVTYAGHRPLFRGFNLGGLWELPHGYSDPLRARVITALTRALLDTHDVVVRCDVDEFLIGDPTFYRDLPDFVARTHGPYVTARGIDVIEATDDAPFDFAGPVLNVQRHRAVRRSALNKTAITRVPLAWKEGFHACDQPPVMGDLYLFHLKFADVKGRISWFGRMRQTVADGGVEAGYSSIDREGLLRHQSWLLSLPETDGWSALVASGFDERFVAECTRNPENGRWSGPFHTGDATFRIPREFTGII